MEARLSPELEEYALEIIEYLEHGSLAESVLEKIADASKEFPDELILWNYFTALYLCKIGKTGHAYSILKKANNISNNNPEVVYVLAVISALLGLSDEALFYIKLSSITENPREDLIPEWLVKFETAFLYRGTEVLFDEIRYLMHTGNYYIAYERSYDLLLAYENDPTALALFIQISVIINQPYKAINFAEKLINYFEGKLRPAEAHIIADVFLALGQFPEAFSLLEEGQKNIDITKISPFENRLFFLADPTYHIIKSYYRTYQQTEKQLLEQEYCDKFKTLEIKNTRELLQAESDKGRNKIKLGVFISTAYNNEDRLFYFALKLQLFKNTNLFIYFYFDRAKHDKDIAQYGYITNELFYVSKIDSQTLADIIYNDGIDLMIDINDHAIPSRADLWHRKPAKVNILYAGNPETAGLWGYDAVMGDKNMFPLADESTLETGEAIIEHPKNIEQGQATILRLRKNLLQYILSEKSNIEAIPNKEHVVIGIYARKIDINAEKIIFLRQLLQQHSNIQIMFDIIELGGEIAFQQVMEEISDGNDELQARLTSTSEALELSLHLFVLYPDIILNLTPSNINLVKTAMQHQRICLCYSGATPTEKVDASILLNINPEFANQLVFDDWQNYMLMVKKLIEDKILRQKYQQMIKDATKSNYQEISENIIVNYDDFSFILSNFFNHKLV